MKRATRLLAVAAAGSALAIGAALWRSPAPGPAAPAAGGTDAAAAIGALREQVASLRAALEQETLARETLESEIALMRTVLEQRVAIARRDAAPAGADADAQSEDSGSPAFDVPGATPANRGFDEASLRAAGLDEGSIDSLRRSWEEAQLARLELADRAAREGWLFKPRHRRELAAVDGALREELGEAGYDQMLFATGQPNRVVVQQVLGGSAAERAGLRPGDRILRYDGVPVYRGNELRAATTHGTRGETVRVEIERDGDRRTLALPRGPIGVLTVPQRTPPER